MAVPRSKQTAKWVLKSARQQTASSTFKGLSSKITEESWRANNRRVIAESFGSKHRLGRISSCHRKAGEATSPLQGLECSQKLSNSRDDEWMDGWMDLVLSAVSEPKSCSACLQQSDGTQMGCAGNVWTACKTKGRAAHAPTKDVFSLYPVQNSARPRCWCRWIPLRHKEVDTSWQPPDTFNRWGPKWSKGQWMHRSQPPSLPPLSVTACFPFSSS